MKSKKEATELRLWGHAQNSTHNVLLGKHCRIVVFPPSLHDEFYTFLRAIMDPPGGEFNSYKSKRLATPW